MNRPRLVRMLAALAIAGSVGVGPLHAAQTRLEDPLANGRVLLEAGQFQNAAAAFERAAEDCRRQGHRLDEIAARIALGAALRSLGQYCSAAQHLEDARSLAQAIPAPALIMQAEADLGNAHLYSRRWEEAEELLSSALNWARALGDQRIEATVLHNLGTVLIARATPAPQVFQRDARGFIARLPGEHPSSPPHHEALQLYHTSANLAADLSDDLLWLKIRANHARTLQLQGDPLAAQALCQEAWPRLAALPNSRDRAFLRLTFGHLAATLAPRLPDEGETLRAQAAEAYREALREAETLADLRIQTYACGFLGELSLETGRLPDAARSAQQALFLAQKAGIEEARFQWLWLLGRILRAQGDEERALTAYRSALQALDNLRSDFSLWLSVRGAGHSFRVSLGDVYFELADLLLKRAARGTIAEEVQRDLLEARSTVELLKSVEVEDYFFDDDCAQLFRAKEEPVEGSVERSAVVYIIPLEDRTELLVSLPAGLRQVRSPVGRRTLTAEVHRWRSELERPDSLDYLRPAENLWNWLVAPLEGLLLEAEIDTLVFVPDGALRTVPMAALYDGSQFLIERFAVAVSPGLSLMEPGRAPSRHLHLLLCGVSEPVHGFPALDFVPAELTGIANHFNHRLLLDEAFSIGRFKQEMATGNFNAVHLASHGEFGSDARSTFVLTHDGRLTLDLLEQLILPRMLSEKPIELLTLSACRTAAGDDRAALGLAGVAVKSGARSALATLWHISDEAAEKVMSAFYANLRQDPSISKAEALRRAQCAQLRNPYHRHPAAWSPFLLIGNWL